MFLAAHTTYDSQVTCVMKGGVFTESICVILVIFEEGKESK